MTLLYVEKSGMNEDVITNIATAIGGYFAMHIDPKNDEQRLLADLKNAANNNQK